VLSLDCPVIGNPQVFDSSFSSAGHADLRPILRLTRHPGGPRDPAV